jgi:hypothetical protein
VVLHDSPCNFDSREETKLDPVLSREARLGRPVGGYVGNYDGIPCRLGYRDAGGLAYG